MINKLMIEATKIGIKALDGILMFHYPIILKFSII